MAKTEQVGYNLVDIVIGNCRNTITLQVWERFQ